MRPRFSSALMFAIGIAAVSACDGDRDEPRSSGVWDPPERTFEALDLRILWTRGGPQDDTAFFQPEQIVGDELLVVVADWGAHRVKAVDTRTGTDHWTFGRRGEGPGEFNHLTSLVTEGTGWTVWDQSVGRLTHLTSNGELDRLQSLRMEPLPGRICPQGSGTYAALLPDRDRRVAVIDTAGTIQRSSALPWPELQDLHPLQTQARWAGTGDDCTLLLAFSTGFARFAVEGFASPAAYVEPIPAPSADEQESRRGTSVRLDRATLAGMGGIVRGSELWILFGGSTPERGRLIDIYDLESGHYDRTHRLPFRASSLGQAGDVLVFASTQDGYPTVVAAEVGVSPQGSESDGPVSPR